MTEFSLSDGAFPSLVAEGTMLHCKKEACMCGMCGVASWSDVRAVPCQLFACGFYLGLIASATVSDTCNESVNPFVTRPLDMAPFTHHQRPSLLGPSTRVMIQHNLQLSLLEHRTDGLDVDLGLHPCCQVPSMKYLSR